MKPKEKEEGKEIESINSLVVKDYPNQQVRKVIDEEGNKIELLSVEDALTEVLTKIRDIHRIVNT